MIDILMATFNGEKYLRSQIDSILQQKNQDWHLIIRDDCSIDETIAIIKEYQLLRPEQIVFIQADQPGGSAQNNFFQLLQYSTSSYVMFADQDDVWLSNKVQLTLDKMMQLEQEYGKTTPLLVHTDLAVVDKKLKPINASLFAMQDMDAKRDQFNSILVQNIVTGCTMMVNRALLDLIIKIPEHAIMHDMWFALIAAAFGKIGFIKQPTLLYRQHGNNANGAKNVKTLQYLLWKLSSGKEIHQGLVQQYQQAEEFLNLYEEHLPLQQKQMLKDYASLEEANIFRKFEVLNQYSLFKKGILKKIGQIIR